MPQSTRANETQQFTRPDINEARPAACLATPSRNVRFGPGGWRGRGGVVAVQRRVAPALGEPGGEPGTVS